VLPKPLGHLVATVAVGHQQNTVQSVIVPRFFGAIDFILQGQRHRDRIADLEPFHAGTLGDLCLDGNNNMLHYL
jgi:hypothetical protein